MLERTHAAEHRMWDLASSVTRNGRHPIAAYTRPFHGARERCSAPTENSKQAGEIVMHRHSVKSGAAALALALAAGFVGAASARTTFAASIVPSEITYERATPSDERIAVTPVVVAAAAVAVGALAGGPDYRFYEGTPYPDLSGELDDPAIAATLLD
jgi:hypothetical protein